MIEVIDLADLPVDQKLQDTIDRFNDTPLSELTHTQRRFNSRTHGVQGVISQPLDAAPLEESDRLMIVPGAFAYPLKVPAVGSQFLADLHGLPVVAVTSPIPSWHFSLKDRLAILSGNFDPYSEQYQKFIDARIPNVGRIAVAGGSMGATIGMNFSARASQNFDITSTVVGDPPNTTSRSAPKLLGDFGADSLDETVRHIWASGIAALSEARRLERPYAEQRELAKYVGSILRRASSNLLAGTGMTRSTFERDLTTVESREIPTVIAFGRESAIAYVSVMRAMALRHDNDTTSWVEVRDAAGKAGHTWLDDLRGWAAVTRMTGQTN